MQPKIVEVAYLSSGDLEGLSSQVTEKMNKKEEYWDFFGDLKYYNDKYIQVLIRINTGE